MIPTYFTINSILILFLDENKKMSQNISHQPQTTKAPDESRAKISSLYYHTLSLLQFLQKQNQTLCRY